MGQNQGRIDEKASERKINFSFKVGKKKEKNFHDDT